MIDIDGIKGEGGGQILRTALALSLVTGKPFLIRNIRAKRSKPGLMRQHLTCVNAAARIGGADVEGNDIGSRTLRFAPKTITPGRYHFAIGTAGSCTLVLQTVLPALLVAREDSEITLEGGTHNPFAPPFDFLEKAFLGIINKMGPRVSCALERPGFYPAGGGKFTVKIHPAADVPVGPFLADQLLIPMAMAGSGRFITGPLTRHTTTNIDVIKQFIDVNISCKEIDTRRWEVAINN